MLYVTTDRVWCQKTYLFSSNFPWQVTKDKTISKMPKTGTNRLAICAAIMLTMLNEQLYKLALDIISRVRN